VSAVTVTGAEPLSGKAIAFGQDGENSTGHHSGGKAAKGKDQAAKAAPIETGQGEEAGAEAYAIRKEIPAVEDFRAYGISSKKTL